MNKGITICDLRLTIGHWSLAIGYRLLALLLGTSLFLTALSAVAASNEPANPNEIPPLRPPKPEIPPGYWEQHKLALILTAAGAVLVIAGLWRLLAQRKAEIPPSPAEIARESLHPLRHRPVDSQLLSEVSRILRDYFISSFGLARQEFTNNELSRQLHASEQVNKDLASRTAALLQSMDNRRFDPDANTSALDVVEEALKLIDQSEEHLRQMSNACAEQQAQPGAQANPTDRAPASFERS